MKRSKVVVPWHDGLHLRPAVKLVRLSERFRSIISLRCGGKIADLRSIVGIITLCAAMGATLYVEATGDDEQDAVEAVEQVFSSNESDGSPDGRQAERA